MPLFSVNSLSGGNIFGKIYNLYKHIIGLLFLNESLQLFSISNMVNIDRYNLHKHYLGSSVNLWCEVCLRTSIPEERIYNLLEKK